ncbi:MAG TPA: CBS domain-containing protein [Burkholderiaceae bacterium]|nr:CBS domain-containing protein [Burkholderiaceae bacterium]
MEELNVGVIPVCDGDRLVGMVTDRDIVVRGVAQGQAADQTPLREVMSAEPMTCFEDQSVEEVMDRMRDSRARRVPVLDRERHLVGILSLGDVAVKAGERADEVSDTLEGISEPAEPDRSGQSQASGAAGGGAASGQPRRSPGLTGERS